MKKLKWESKHFDRFQYIYYDALKCILHTRFPNKRAKVMIDERLFDLFEEGFHKQNASIIWTVFNYEWIEKFRIGMRMGNAC